MLRRPAIALLLAAACLAGLVLTGVLAYLVPVAHQGDAATLHGFVQLNEPQLTPAIDRVAHLADPVPYALGGIALALLAFARGRRRVALAIPLLLFLTGATTETLKHALASPRYAEWLGGAQINAVSWPSGHATAAMTLALLAVLASPARLRPTVAAGGAAFALAVSYAILALGWHFPSDVLGGYLVAGLWVSLGVAGLAVAERRLGPDRRHGEARVRWVDAMPALVLAALAGGLAIALAVRRPHAMGDLAADHTTFLAGAAAIAALAVATPLAVTTVATRPDPTAARRPRWPRG
jgi:membrane-associated phospholipid phosphatase